MQAQASNADVVAILNGGDDTINAVKTAIKLCTRRKIPVEIAFVRSVDEMSSLLHCVSPFLARSRHKTAPAIWSLWGGKRTLSKPHR